MKDIELKLPTLYAGSLVKRPNRFLAEVQLENEIVRAFVADPGRLKELLYPQAQVYLAHVAKKERSTNYDLRLVRKKETLISVDSRVPNKIIAQALSKQALEPFAQYTDLKSEPRSKGGRLDFLLTAETLPPCYVEVKSCTLVEGTKGLFPDAPTARGTRHLTELIEFKKEGNRTAVVFVIQHPGATVFAPHTAMDPDFSRALATACEHGVEIYAYKCRITLESILLLTHSTVPVIMS